MLIQNELSVSMFRCSYLFSLSRATVMAASLALLIVCLSGCDLISVCVMVFVRGLTTPAPRVGLPLICEPSVHTKSWGFHFRLWGLVCSMFVCVCGFTGAGVFVYDLLLSML